MQITGAFLAEQAEIVDQKLNVQGGVLDWVAVPVTGLTNENGEQLVRPLTLVTLMQAGPDDEDRPYRMKLEMVASDGDLVTIFDGEIPLGAHQGENRFWVTPFGLHAAKNGRMVLIQTIEGGGTVSVPIEVRIVERV